MYITTHASSIEKLSLRLYVFPRVYYYAINVKPVYKAQRSPFWMPKRGPRLFFITNVSLKKRQLRGSTSHKQGQVAYLPNKLLTIWEHSYGLGC